jgi:hypothetical protein
MNLPRLWRKTSLVTNQNRMRFHPNLDLFAARLREFIRSSQPPTEFDKLAVELFGLQYELNEPYRTFCQARGVSPGTVSQWKLIPAVPTSVFKELELCCIPPAERTAIFYSSGTTTHHLSRHFHNRQSLALYEASLLPWFETNVPAPLSGPWPIVCLTPNSKTAPHSSLAYMFETVVREFGSEDSMFLGTFDAEGSWSLNLDATCDCFDTLESADKPALVLGTAFSLVHLLEHLAGAGRKFKLPAGSRAMETGGYKGRSRSLPKPELHRLISEHLGISQGSIISEYGMSELSSQAYDTHIGGGSPLNFRFPPWARAQIILPESGREVAENETGLLRVFDLANAYSVLAVQTEDLAIRRGNEFELIGRAVNAEPRGCSLMST